MFPLQIESSTTRKTNKKLINFCQMVIRFVFSSSFSLNSLRSTFSFLFFDFVFPTRNNKRRPNEKSQQQKVNKRQKKTHRNFLNHQHFILIHLIFMTFRNINSKIYSLVRSFARCSFFCVNIFGVNVICTFQSGVILKWWQQRCDDEREKEIERTKDKKTDVKWWGSEDAFWPFARAFRWR